MGLGGEAFEVDAEDCSFFEIDTEAAGVKDQGCGAAQEGFMGNDEESGF